MPFSYQKGGKGKAKGPNRAWKSENFPANYDQVTPALQEENQREWWETEDELSSACFQDTLFDSTSMAAIDEDELDEETADLIELHFVSIIHQLERNKLYITHPNAELQTEIELHAEYIRFAGSLLDLAQQQVIARFTNLVGYIDPTSIQTTSTELNSTINEPDLSPTAIQIPIFDKNSTKDEPSFSPTSIQTTSTELNSTSNEPDLSPTAIQIPIFEKNSTKDEPSFSPTSIQTTSTELNSTINEPDLSPTAIQIPIFEKNSTKDEPSFSPTSIQTTSTELNLTINEPAFLPTMTTTVTKHIRFNQLNPDFSPALATEFKTNMVHVHANPISAL